MKSGTRPGYRSLAYFCGTSRQRNQWTSPFLFFLSGNVDSSYTDITQESLGGFATCYMVEQYHAPINFLPPGKNTSKHWFNRYRSNKKPLRRDFIFLMRNLEPVKTYGIDLHKKSIPHLCLPQGQINMFFFKSQSTPVRIYCDGMVGNLI